MNKDQYFDSLLNSDRLVINYDEMQDMLSDGRETFDVLPCLAYQLSERVQTPQHYARARKIVSEMGLICLEFNMSEAGNDFAADLLELQELPELTAEVSTCINSFM